MPSAIKSVADRKKLLSRREPYWDRLEAGCYVGYRKLVDGTGTWIARWRSDEGGQKYHALGSFPDYDSAVRAAREWFEQCKGGSTEVIDVAEACRRYTEDRRAEKGEKTAMDAEGRFSLESREQLREALRTPCQRPLLTLWQWCWYLRACSWSMFPALRWCEALKAEVS